MKLSVRLFAGLAEQIGLRSIILEDVHELMTAKELKITISNLYPQVAELIPICWVAVNQNYANDDSFLHESDEIALIPPVSGGAGDNPNKETGRYNLTVAKIDTEQTAAQVYHPDHGASIVFIGTTREHTNNMKTMHLEYEAYEPMAILTMKQIAEEIHNGWPGIRCAITHRLGIVPIGEASVVIAVSAPHRKTAYEASQFAINRLKEIVPIWKKEIWDDGSEWIGHQLGPRMK